MHDNKTVEGYRFSPQQLRLWSIQRELGTTFARCSVAIDGPLDVPRLEAALQRLLERHSILRTSFCSVPGVPVPLQVVAEDIGSTQLKYQLQTQSSEYHVLEITLPNLCADTRSLQNIVSELAGLYATNDEIREPALSYVQFSEWQNEILEDQEHGASVRKHWQAQDVTRAANVRLPNSRTDAGGQTFIPARVAVTFTAEEVARVEEYAREQESTSTGVWLGCWQAVLWRMTGQEQLVIGYAASGRKYEEMSTALGLFAKWVPVTAKLEELRSISDVVQRAGKEIDVAEEGQDYFTWEAEGFFAAGYEYEEREVEFTAGPVMFGICDHEADAERYELKLHCVKEGTQVRAELRYDNAVYDATAMERVLACYQNVVRSACGGSAEVLRDVEWVSEAERQYLVHEWNRTAVAYDASINVVQMFEQQVERSPEAVAVVYGEQEISYGELNQRANQLAHHLVSLGVRPEVRVGILLERSVEMVVAVLGVLKAGGAYVPLDLKAPAERLAFMLEDAQVPLLLCTDSKRDMFPGYQGKSVCLDSEWEQIAQQSTENLAVRVAAENLAYVIYTSGSTGRPKGTLITHRGLHNYLNWALQNYPLAEGTGAPVHSPLSFDLTVTSLFTPLLSGKRVRLVPEEAGVDGLVEVLQSGEHFSLVKLTPAHLEVLAQQLGSGSEVGQCSCALVIGGEALLTEQVRFWMEQASGVRLYNEYGPTETVVGCCVYEVGTNSDGLRVPIGRAIGNTRLYILDERQELVPAGVVGELYISGAGVARGYHERAELTAERFVPDPYSGVSGARMYRSGDLAQHLGSGEIEYVGRVDEQVKVRGYRVELGEIEAVIGEQAGVREAVVVQRDDEAGGKRLVAYVVSDGQFKSSEMREQLQIRLPEYMVPAVFVRLEEMPLTRNGKVDRKALPAPDESRPEIEEEYVAPRNETETVLAAIWSEVLGVDQVGVHDNFFELGGHSLLATQVISRVRDTFRVELLLRNLFDATTVAQLALVIDEQQAKPAVTEINSLPMTTESSVDVDALLAELEQLSEGEAQSMLQLN